MADCLYCLLWLTVVSGNDGGGGDGGGEGVRDQVCDASRPCERRQEVIVQVGSYG